MKNKKYTLLKSDTKTFLGKILYRIKAKISFGIVIKGELGGYIEKEDNLSVSGNAWVYGNAWVSGDALVYGNARVYGNAWVYGNARVYGNAWVSGDALVYGNAWVYGDAKAKFYWHIHHETLVEPLTEPLKNRIKYIKEEKSKSETEEQIELRLKLLKKVKGKIVKDWNKIEALHKRECPNCSWDGKTIFGGKE